ncbi:MAG: acetate/propionate family kinase [Candidatus Kerfeldbacteria bacterium]|nr:acetate/propionate family kinase [Candidatus Kerfeldbacteria bacterium]
MTQGRKSTKASHSTILALNVGSSSIKLAVVHATTLQEQFRIHAEMRNAHQAIATVIVKKRVVRTVKISDAKTLPDLLHHMLLEAVQVFPNLLETTCAVGHRFVHGGELFFKPTILSKDVFQTLSELEHLAPLHHPYELAGMTAAVAFFPDATQYVVFDTGFFHALKPHVYLYALPYTYYRDYGIRRFGFHGISHEYLLQETARTLRKPVRQLHVVTCHLGSGSSLAVIRNGMPLDTTMGFSPSEGLTMATRVGDLDPMIVLALQQQLKLTPEEISDLLYHESGLKGVSGFSADLRDILATAGHATEGGVAARGKEHQRRARLALDMYLYDIQRYLASYIGLLPRVHAIVFSGAAGAANAALRRMILSGVPAAKGIRVLAIETHEELHIARNFTAATT